MTRTARLPLISDYPEHHASQRPTSDALVLDGERTTYEAFSSRVDRCARALHHAGVGRGDRVATLSTPRPDYLVLFMATARVGGIWLGLDPRARFDELEYIVGDATPKMLFAIARFEERDYRGDLTRLMQAYPSLEGPVFLETGEAVEGTSFEDFLSRGDAVDEVSYGAAREAVDPDDPALIVYTSGSTGRPKGALLAHRGIVTTARVQCEHWWAEPFRMLNNLPINHIGGAVQISCHAHVAGGTNVFMERFAPGKIPSVVEQERITIMHQVPTMYQLTLVKSMVEQHDVSSLQTLIWSGAPAPLDLIVKLRKLTPNLYSSYGSTETGGEVLYTPDGTSDALLAETVGQPESVYAVRLADELGHPVDDGAAGEIQVRGEAVMRGYFDKPEANAEAFTEDGWLRTGDVAVIQPDGNYRIVGRLREMFKSGGYNVYPREIELVIESHPAVAMAAVIGVPDPLYTEVGHAYILKESGALLSASEVDSFCRERVANYKIPKRFVIRDSLPMLPIGKIDKAALKQEAGRGARKA